MEEDLKKILTSNTSSSLEKYNASIKLAEHFEKNESIDKAAYYYVRSFFHDNSRVSGIYKLIVHYCCEGQNQIADNYFSFIKPLYESGNVHPDDSEPFNFYIPYYMLIVSQRSGNKSTVPLVTKRLFESKIKNIPSWYVRNLIYNIQYVLDSVDKPLLQEYVMFLIENGYDIETVSSVNALEKFGIRFKFPPRFTEEQCKQSNKILFYTGFANPHWNYTYSINNALGGSETAVAYLSKCFPKTYEVYVTGEVVEETVDNVHYVHLRNIQSLLNDNPFHTIIISRYVAFFEMFKFWSYQTYVWGHDTVLLPYGCNMNASQIIEKWHNKITGVICLTQWHKELFSEYYPSVSNKIHIINNGIKDDLFHLSVPKIKNRFVYTSCSNRGLKRLLELWSSVLAHLPDAQLRIASYATFPSNDEDRTMNEYIQKTPSVQHLGKLGSRDLYELISSSEYWLYPTCWHETSCITALEMLRCGVICIYYPVAGLPYTMGGNGFAVQKGEEIDTILKLTEYEKAKQIQNGKDYVNKCSWRDRYIQWSKLLFGETKYPIKIVNLERRTDRKSKMIERLNSQNITSYEFVNAVDGKLIKPTRELYDMFKGNDFNFRKGVIGCALSHINIWKSLVDDKDNKFYVVLEDDIEFAENAKVKLDVCCNLFNRDESQEYLFIGAQHITTPNKDVENLSIRKMNMREYHGQGTFGYIISKRGAQKLLDYIRTNCVKYAIDKPIFYYGLNVNAVNEYVVRSEVYGNNMNVDSDIQAYHDSLDMSGFEKTKYIAFCDWWKEEYGGGIFDYRDNFFVNMLRSYSGYNIEVVEPHENPDVLFYSMFGNEHKKYTCRKVFYCGESHSKRDDADYNLTFEADSEKNTRFPLWLCYLSDDFVNECKRRKNGVYNIPDDRSNFCSFVASNPGKDNIRKQLVETISSYKPVACGGEYLNNIGTVIGRGKNASGKLQFNQLFKFSTAFENMNTMPGYCTEKILDVFKANAIPIYWGHPNVTHDFNEKTFINANRFGSWNDMTEYIKLVDNDKDAYEDYFKHSMLTDEWLNKLENGSFYRSVSCKILGSVATSSSE